MELWIVRHGETADNHLRVIAGHGPGGLSELGVSQAIKTGKRLCQETFGEIYCSDLVRTKETLENILSSHPKKETLAITYSELLREKGAGILQGKPLATSKELAEKSGLPLRRFKAEEAESWEDVYNRAEKFIEGLLAKYIHNKNVNIPKQEGAVEESKGEDNGKSNEGVPKILVVTHGGWIMELFNAINYRVSKIEPVLLNNTMNCSVNILRISASENNEVMYEIVRRNDVTHLL